MTLLGAVVFGGLLALGVLWLLVTDPDGDVDEAWGQAQWSQHSSSISTAAGADVSGPWVLTHSAQE
jgi:hypothetical protein